VGFRIGDFKLQIDPALLERKGRAMRRDGRAADQLRPVTITPRYSKHAERDKRYRSSGILFCLAIAKRLPRLPANTGCQRCTD